MTANSIIGRQPLIQTSLLSLLSLSSLSSQKKVYTRYVIVENNNIYISDIIISIIYTLLITPGSEITSQEKKSVFHPSIYIGKMDGWKYKRDERDERDPRDEREVSDNDC